MQHVVIIGNGVSGITAARNIRKRSNGRITVISSETDHFFSRTALMYIYMGHMKFEHTKPYEDWFWKKNKIELIRDHVEKVEPATQMVYLKSGVRQNYDTLIIASGSAYNKGGWPGENLKGVQGLYSYPDLQQMEQSTQNCTHAVVVGGGLIGVEMAEMLLSRKIDVTFLVREPEFWSNILPLQEAAMISRHVRSHHIDLRLNAALKEIVPDENGNVKAIITSEGETIHCQFVGLTIGVSPNIQFLKGSGIETNRGILVNEFLQTNLPNIYAIGDCVERKYDLPYRRRIEQVWYTGRMMGEVVAQTVCGEKTKYEPGPWFNSAKFFDIEYQTYGHVAATLPDGELEFYWENATGLKSIHLRWIKQTNEFIGINVFGIRMRHECFDRWLREKQSISFVLAHFAEANFDPEFYRRHEVEIISAFRQSFPSLVQMTIG